MPTTPTTPTPVPTTTTSSSEPAHVVRARRKTLLILGCAGTVTLGALALTAARADESAPTPPPTPTAVATPTPPPAPTPVATPTPPHTPVVADPTPAPAPTPAPHPAAARPRIDVVFVLDTTGSMAGLIAGAKRKIWSLANEIASGQPRPIVRFGLVAYRDRTDEYVTRVAPLTSDMDAMYDKLMALRANGGGDTPEDVNSALNAAVTKMKWGRGQNVLKLVFLVGDAPPHDDYTDVPTSKRLARMARRKGIIINTVRCGSAADTRRAWRRIASVAGGDYASIAQSGGMVATVTPYDRELERLNRELADTTIAYGTGETRTKVRRKMRSRRAMAGEVAADAASFAAKSGVGLGKGDLVARLGSGTMKLDDVREDSLPAEYRKMSDKQRKAAIRAKTAKRKKIERKLAAVAANRDRWIKRNEKKTSRDSFDRKVMRSLAAQATDIGVSFD